MSDLSCFVCLGVAFAGTFVAVLAARAIITGSGGLRWGIVLTLAAAVGIIATLPFRKTDDLPMLPIIAGAILGSLVVSSFLSYLCHLTPVAKSHE